MKTNTMIIVGGFGRAGTNSVLLYLHLNDNVFGFVSGNDAEFDGDFYNYIHLQVPQTLRTSGQTTPDLDRLRAFIDQKNARFYTGTDPNFEFTDEFVIDHYKYLARKHERIEVRNAIDFFAKTGMHLKFIFCVRNDFHQLYLSRKENRKPDSSEEFVLKCLDSFHQMQRIARRYDSCCIDVTDGCVSSDYKDIDRMLRLESSDWQDWWRDNNPKTNARAAQDLGKREAISGISDKNIAMLRRAYYKTRSRLIK